MGLFKFLVYSSLLVIIQQIDLVKSGLQQKLTFYESEFCTKNGKSETYMNKTLYLKGTWSMVAKSVRILGIWRTSLANDLLPNYIYQKTMVTLPPNGVCIDMTAPHVPHNFSANVQRVSYPILHIIRAERVGPSDFESSEIIFFTGTEYDGVPITMNRDMFAFNEGVFTMKSAIQFTNQLNQAWVTFSKPWFTGDMFCFCARTHMRDKDDSRSIPYTFYDDVVRIGSGRRDHGGKCKCGAIFWKHSVFVTIVLVGSTVFLSYN